MVEKLESIVAQQAKAISNLKIDKITVWDSAGGSNEGSSTSNFVSSSTRASLPSMTSPAWQESTSRTTSARWLRRPRPSETVRHR